MRIDSQLQLVNAIKSNDQLALKELYQKNYKKVEIYIIQNSGSMPQAKDIYQEAFLAMFQNVKAGKFTPTNETALQGYLYQISKNKWRDYLRSAQFKKTAAFTDNFHQSDEADIFEIDEYVENDKRLDATMNAFERIGDECKELLTKFYFKKESLRDIANALNLGEASARNKKYRCIQKLREIALSPN